MGVKRTIFWGYPPGGDKQFPTHLSMSDWEDALIRYHESQIPGDNFNFTLFGQQSVQMMLADYGFIEPPEKAISVAESSGLPVSETIRTGNWEMEPYDILQAIDRWSEVVGSPRASLIRYAIQFRLENMYSSRLKEIGKLALGDATAIVTPLSYRSEFVSDEEWEKLYGFLSQKPNIYTGNENTTRVFIEGVMWLLRNETDWACLPKEYGNSEFAKSQYEEWEKKGVWAAISEHFPDYAEVLNNRTGEEGQDEN